MIFLKDDAFIVDRITLTLSIKSPNYVARNYLQEIIKESLTLNEKKIERGGRSLTRVHLRKEKE